MTIERIEGNHIVLLDDAAPEILAELGREPEGLEEILSQLLLDILMNWALFWRFPRRIG